MITQEQGAGPGTPPLPEPPPFQPEKAWHARPGVVIVLVIVGIVLAGHAIEWIQEATTDERAEMIDYMTDHGYAATEAERTVKQLEARFHDVADVPETREGLSATLEPAATCRGGLAGTPNEFSECMADATTERSCRRDRT